MTHTIRKTKLRQWLVTGREGMMTLADAPDFLTMDETAAILRIGRNQVYELARVWRATDGERGVPVVEFGRLLRVPKAALLRLAGLAEPAGNSRAR
jgi:hypothetical protein